MSNYEQKPDTGALFKADKKGNEKAPDYTGDYTTPDGQKRRIAAWINESKTGKKYMSLKFSDMQQKQPQDYPQEKAENTPMASGSLYDDIPFAPVDWRT